MAKLLWYGDQVQAKVEDHIGRRIQMAARETRDYAREKLSVAIKAAGFKAVKRGPTKAARAKSKALRAATHGGSVYQRMLKELNRG